MADWVAIKGEYITSDISQRKLAEKYHVSPSTIRDKAKREGWKEEKDAFSLKIAQKTKEIAEEHEIDRIEKLLSLSDQLTDKIQEAINQLDIYMAKDRIKTKTKAILTDKNGDKKEVEETKDVERVKKLKAPIDRLGLRQLTAALKDIKDIQIEIGATEDEYDSSGLMDAIKAIGNTLNEDDDSAMLPIEEDGEEE